MNTTATRPDVYLIHHNGIGALVKLCTSDTSADRFGEMQRAFAAKAGSPSDYAEMIRLHHDQTAESLFYDWELAGPAGASYRLIKWPTTPGETVERAKADLRHRFDVVALQIVSIRRLIDFPESD